MLETEQGFREVFCRKSALDWTQHRLAVHVPFGGGAEREFVVVHLRHDDRLHLLIEPVGACRSGGFASSEAFGVVLPKGSSDVEFLEGSGLEPQPPCQDDIGY